MIESCRSIRRWAPRQHEQGQTLVLVLAFLIVIGALAGALAGQIEPSFVQSNVVQKINDEVAAADQGIRYGIQSLKADSTICAAPSTTPFALPNYVTPNTGLAVQVQCETVQGFSAGVFGWAVITNDRGPASFTDSSGGDKLVTGPVFNAGGWNLAPGKTTTVKNGNVVAEGSVCAKPANLVVSPNPPFTYTGCGTMAVPVPAHQLPSSVPGPAPAPNTTFVPGCRILYPGTYNSPPNLSGDVYMVSGTYYFNNLGNLQVGTTLFGGQPKSPETQDSTTGAPCATDAMAHAGNVGYGVEIMFGGNTTLSINNNSTMELFTRNPVSDDGSTPYITLYQVPCAASTWSSGCSPQTPGWSASTLAPNTQFLSMGNGAHVWGSVHGAVYAPQGSVGVFATNSSQAVLGGGTDVYDLTLQSSASASGLLVSIGLTPGVRYTVLKATVLNLAKPISARAVVEIANDASRTATIDSWRTCQDNDPTQDPRCAGSSM